MYYELESQENIADALGITNDVVKIGIYNQDGEGFSFTCMTDSSQTIEWFSTFLALMANKAISEHLDALKLSKSLEDFNNDIGEYSKYIRQQCCGRILFFGKNSPTIWCFDGDCITTYSREALSNGAQEETSSNRA